MATYKWFEYNGKYYNEGTRLLFNGYVQKHYGQYVYINNEEIIFLERMPLYRNYITYFIIYNEDTYGISSEEFFNGIVSVGVTSEKKKDLPQKVEVLQEINKKDNDSKISDEYYIPSAKQKEIIWDDWMVAKTLWYIVIMVIATIFYGRIGIWILATIIWYLTTIKNAPRA